MTETRKTPDGQPPVRGDPGLDALFDLARQDLPEPDPGLAARILADAAETMPRPAAVAHRDARPGRLGAFLRVIGGWPSLAGMATAMVVGLWIGISGPDGLPLVDDAFGQSGTDLFLNDLLMDLTLSPEDI